jgi:hypothetical protein
MVRCHEDARIPTEMQVLCNAVTARCKSLISEQQAPEGHEELNQTCSEHAI